MSEQKQSSQHMPRKARGTKKAKLPSAVHEDWPMLAGRIPHMNSVAHRDDQIYKFVEYATTDAVLTISNTTPTSVGITFTLASLPGAAAFTGLFDQYRIKQIEAWLIPTIAPGGNNSNSIWKSVVDYDNTATTATAAFFDTYNNCHSSMLNSGHYRKFTPHAAIAAYSGTFTSFANEPCPWIDSAYPSVNHYGIKLFSEVATTNTVDLIARYHVEFRNKI